MAPGRRRYPPDEIGDQLIAIYAKASKRLTILTAAAIERGATGTARYYEGQRAAIQNEIRKLKRDSARARGQLIRSAYLTGLSAIDRVLKKERAFTGLHDAAMEVLAANLDERLRSAEDRIGREVDDVFRRAALESVASGVATGLTPKQRSDALARDLRAQGITAFTDRKGRRWNLDTYASMVVRTTTREAMSAGMANRLADHGRHLVEISHHRTACPICKRYEGRTFTLTEEGPPANVLLDQLPPFHPNAVIEGTRIEADGELRGGVRATWNGPLVHLASASGIRLAIGPNHPVLTARGWIVANALRVGDHVLRRVGGERRHPVIDHHLDQREARAEDVFDALAVVGSRASAPATGDDLHGDGRYCEGEIDVVRADGLLLDELDTLRSQEFREPHLVGADAPAKPLTGEGACAATFHRHAGDIARTLANHDPELVESAEQGSGAERETFGEVLGRLASLVAEDEIIEIGNVESWSGQAFDFETTRRAYFADGLYVSNCRHILIPARVTFEAMEAALGLGPDPLPPYDRAV